MERNYCNINHLIDIKSQTLFKNTFIFFWNLHPMTRQSFSRISDIKKTSKVYTLKFQQQQQQQQ